MSEEMNALQTEVTTDLAFAKVVNETEDFRILQLPDGKFKKQMKYKKFWSRIPQTEDESKLLYSVFNDDGIAIPMLQAKDKVITIKDVYMNPYEAFDEETGGSTPGVVTVIETVDGMYFVSSSKSVYFTLFNLFDSFGYPADNDYNPIKVKIIHEKVNKNTQVTLKLA